MTQVSETTFMHSKADWHILQDNKQYADLSYLDNRALAYGDGFFTTMGVYQGKLLWLDYHRRRIISHASALELQFDLDKVIHCIETTAQSLQNGILKLVVIREPQSVRGYGYHSDHANNNGNKNASTNANNNARTNSSLYLKSVPMTVMMGSADISGHSDAQLHLNHSNLLMGIPIQPIGKAVCLSAKLSVLPLSLVGLKTLNRLDNVLAGGELEKKRLEKANEGLSIVEGLVSDVSNVLSMLNVTDASSENPEHSENTWVEGVMSNVFYQLNSEQPKGGNIQWYTPPIDKSGVNGVMRQVLMDRLISDDRPVIERPFMDSDLPHVSSMFFCNAVRGIIPTDGLQMLDGSWLSFEWKGV